MAKKKWSDLSASQQLMIYVAGAAESVLTIAAVRDIARRPSRQVRGPKVAWVLAFFVQPFGPLGYFAVGRR
jgi:Phospholipase_D-nuclease N-terminal